MAEVEIKKDTYWRFRKLSADQFILRREVHLSQPRTYFDAMGPVAVLGICHRSSGDLIYRADGKEVPVPWQRYGLFLPPFSVTRASSQTLHLDVDFLITTTIFDDLPDAALVFPLEEDTPKSFDAVAAFLKRLRSYQRIEFNTQPSAVGRKIKNALDASFRESQPLGAIAKSLGISPTLMGRYFKKDFGLTPTAYRNHLRIVSVSFGLIQGAEIVDAFQTVGFDDLSQFYQQFKRVTKAKPGEYRPKKSKITKK